MTLVNGVEVEDSERQKCEVWKDVLGYEGRYQVSNLGRVKSMEHYHPCTFHGNVFLRHKKEQILKQWKRSSYLLVDLWENDERDVRSVHHLVYETFSGRHIQDKTIIHHKNEDKFDNRYENLENLTYKEHNYYHYHKRITENKETNLRKEQGE